MEDTLAQIPSTVVPPAQQSSQQPIQAVFPNLALSSLLPNGPTCRVTGLPVLDVYSRIPH